MARRSERVAKWIVSGPPLVYLLIFFAIPALIMVVASFRSGQFTGETTMLSGRRSLGRIRAAEPTEVIEVDRKDLLSLIQTDDQLGEVLPDLVARV